MSHRKPYNVMLLGLGAALVIIGLFVLRQGGYNFAWGASLLFFGCACFLVSLLRLIRTKKVRLLFLICIFGLALFASIGSCVFVIRLNQPVVNGAAYEKVVNGFTKEQVLALLGQPHEKYKQYGTEECWRYAKWGVWQIVDIYFDAEGRVVGKSMDS
jgi:biotin transporter BioY